MGEVGIDISAHTSKSLEAFKASPVDYVFTLCGGARDRCPLWPEKAVRRHHGFDDPPGLTKPDASDEEALQHYRRVRDAMGAWIKSLPEELTIE